MIVSRSQQRICVKLERSTLYRQVCDDDQRAVMNRPIVY